MKAAFQRDHCSDFTEILCCFNLESQFWIFLDENVILLTITYRFYMCELRRLRSWQQGDGAFDCDCVLVLVLDGARYRLSVGGLRRPSRGCRLVTGSRPWLIQTPPGWPDGAFRFPENKSRPTFQRRQEQTQNDDSGVVT